MYLLLCPLNIELDVLLMFFRQKGFELVLEKVGALSIFRCKDLNFICAQGGHGKVQFAIQTQFLLDSIKDIQAVFCLGTAGGLDTKLKVFDVVAATKTIEHDYRLKFIKKAAPEFKANLELIEDLKNTHKNREKKDLLWTLHFSTMASGDEDIMDFDRAQELFQQTGAQAVAWEGAGGAKACQFSQIPFQEIRGITDMASGQTTIDFKDHLNKAMLNVADVVFQYLNSKKIAK